MYNIPNFAVDFVNSKDIIVDSVIIRGRGFFNLKGSADGLDIEGCSNVAISNCDIEVGDDAIESNDRHRVHNITVRNFTINSCYNPIYFDLQNRKNNNPPGVMGQLDNILIENVNCIKSVSQPIIFNWQCNGVNKMKDITLKNVSIHNFGTEAGVNLTCMDGSYPDANKNGIANAYGIWARGLDGLKLINCKFYDDGGSKREKFVFDSTVKNVNTNARK